MSPTLLFPALSVMTGLLLGGAAAWLLTGSQAPAVTRNAPDFRGGSFPTNDALHSGKSSLTNSRTRLLRLMTGAAQGGGASMARAWTDATGDYAMRLWLADAWLKADPAAFIHMIFTSDESLYPEGEGMALMNLVNQFAEQNPEKAMRIGTTIQPPQAGRWLMSQAILKIMESDPAKGLELAASHPDVRLNGNYDLNKIKVTATDLPQLAALPRSGPLSELIFKAMAEQPKAEAMKWTSQLSSYLRRSVVGKLSQRWVRDDPDAALAFARTEANDQQRIAILSALGEAKISGNPAGAAAWAEENLGGYARNRVLQLSADKLQQTDPAAAEAIRARLPQDYPPKAK
jgi:hypothetical protein